MAEPKLSKGALNIIEKLQHEIKEVITADRVREPKLTPEEKEEVDILEATIAKNRPLVDKFIGPLNEKQARLKVLEMDLDTIIKNDPESIDEVVNELMLLPTYINVLERCHDSSYRAVIGSEARIKRIKELARDREVTHAR